MTTINDSATDRSAAGSRPQDAAEREICPETECPKLRDLLGYLRGLTGRPELDELRRLLGDLDVTPEDLCAWKKFGSRCYKRNVIAKSEHFELLAVCWKSGQATPIHDHKGSACAFRIVQGAGREIRYENTPCCKVVPTATVKMEPGYICAAEDDDIHRVANAEGEDLITMHIYAPPLKGMRTYDGLDAKLTEVIADSGELYAD